MLKEKREMYNRWEHKPYGKIATLTIIRRDGSEHKVVIDAADMEKCSSIDGTWKVVKGKGGHYVGWQRYIDGKSQAPLMLHRYILDIPQDDPRRVDLIDNNGFNCRRGNLKITDQRHVVMGRLKRGLKGELYDPQNDRWDIVFTHRMSEGVVELKGFKTRGEALRARAKMRKKYFMIGSYHKHNGGFVVSWGCRYLKWKKTTEEAEAYLKEYRKKMYPELFKGKC